MYDCFVHPKSSARMVKTLKDLLTVPVLLSNVSVKTFPDTVVTRVTVGRSLAFAFNVDKAVEKACMDSQVLDIRSLSGDVRIIVCMLIGSV